MEACESGSMFEGLLPENISIFATTAANGKESSYAEYCPVDELYDGSSQYDVCLGDLYSISWLEDRYIILISFIYFSILYSIPSIYIISK